eukprot:PhM_4_TR13925/c0_g1_i1/m.100652
MEAVHARHRHDLRPILVLLEAHHALVPLRVGDAHRRAVKGVRWQRADDVAEGYELAKVKSWYDTRRGSRSIIIISIIIKVADSDCETVVIAVIIGVVIHGGQNRVVADALECRRLRPGAVLGRVRHFVLLRRTLLVIVPIFILYFYYISINAASGSRDGGARRDDEVVHVAAPRPERTVSDLPVQTARRQTGVVDIQSELLLLLLLERGSEATEGGMLICACGVGVNGVDGGARNILALVDGAIAVIVAANHSGLPTGLESRALLRCFTAHEYAESPLLFLIWVYLGLFITQVNKVQKL